MHRPIVTVTREITNNGVRIVYDAFGRPNPNPVVLLHGLGGDLTAWDTVRGLLPPDRCYSLAIDLRGHGLSGRPSSQADYTFDAYVSDIAAVLAAEHIDRCILAGHCLGGIIAQHFALAYPGRISKLIICNSGYRAPWFVRECAGIPHFFGGVSALAAGLPVSRPHAYTDYSRYRGTADFDPVRLARDIRNVGLRPYLMMSVMLSKHSVLPGPGAIRMPTVIVGGARDSIYPVGELKRFARLLSDASYHELTGTNHISPLNAPEQLAAILVGVCGDQVKSM
jgi:3-oxoadipate enol-lactonase